VNRPKPTEVVPCNLCGAAEYDVVGRTDRDRRPLQTVLCRRCGLVWTNPRPSPADIDRYYEAEYRADYSGQSTPARRKVLRGLLGARDRREGLRPLLPTGATVLDVGCGAGELVYLLRREDISASGIEPGAEYAGFARGALGVPVQTATVNTAIVAPGSQDLVTMFHCLEHVGDPREVLRAVRGWLKRGGAAVVEVPNVASTVQAPSHRFHYAHLYHFTAETLAALGEAAGLRVVRAEHSSDGGNVTCVFRRDADEERAPAGLEGHAARTRALLRAHTGVRHYLSPTPYVRAVARLRRRRTEDRLLRHLKTVQDIIQWAGDGRQDESSSLADGRKSRLH
jgi:2-polyprenyl-3-methyl-5-hydroxy-6-metoxy-1,4-benzoquinol methylase